MSFDSQLNNPIYLLRNCKLKDFIFVDGNFDHDERSKNSSAFYLMQNDLLDLIGYPYKFGVIKKFVESSKVVSTYR